MAKVVGTAAFADFCVRQRPCDGGHHFNETVLLFTDSDAVFNKGFASTGDISSLLEGRNPIWDEHGVLFSAEPTCGAHM